MVRGAIIDIGRTEAIIPYENKCLMNIFKQDRLRAVLLRIEEDKELNILSRAHKILLNHYLNQVPEINEGL